MVTSDLSETQFTAISRYFHRRCGLVLPSDKRYLVLQRLGPLLKHDGVGDWAGLVTSLEAGKNDLLIDEAIHAITTHETSFFRDRHPFETVGKVLLPRFAEMIRERKARPIRRRGPVFRFWNAAVSTGQECYSLAMTIDRFMHGPNAGGVSYDDWSITATDISSTVLAQSMEGEYTDLEIRRGIDDETRGQYFQQMDGKWRVIDRLRTIMQFQSSSLTEDFSMLGAFDMIWCRNVLIYFDEVQRRKIFDGFVQLLDPGGILILGASESILPPHDNLVPVREGPTTWYECRK